MRAYAEEGSSDAPGERVRETERHGGEVLGVEALEQRRELLTDTTVQVERRRVRDDLDAELLADGAAELRVADDERLLDALALLLGARDLVDEELGQDLGQLAVLELRQVLDGVGRRREAVDRLELEAEERMFEEGASTATSVSWTPHDTSAPAATLAPRLLSTLEHVEQRCCW